MAIVADKSRPSKIDVSIPRRRIRYGVGDPTGVVSAPMGTLFLDTTGGAASTLYVKEGAAIANWAAK